MSGVMSPIERAEAELKRLEGEAGVGEGGEKVDEKANAGPKESDKPTDEGTPSDEGGKEGTAPKGDEGRETEGKKPDKPAEESEESYKQKWLSAHGMHKRFEEQIAALKEQNSLLLGRINQVQAQPQQGQIGVSQEASKEDLKEHVNKLVEEFGEDFLSSLTGFVRGEIDARVDGKVDNVKQEVDKVSQDAQNIRQQNFFRDLTARVSDWRDYYGTPEFDGWLRTQIEPMSGKSYSDLFDDANNSWNLEPLAKFFGMYKQFIGKGAATEASQQHAHESRQEHQADPREALVSPGKGGSGASIDGKGGEQKVWTQVEINKFYRDVRQGVYAGREAEMNALERDLLEANATGRVR